MITERPIETRVVNTQPAQAALIERHHKISLQGQECKCPEVEIPAGYLTKRQCKDIVSQQLASHTKENSFYLNNWVQSKMRKN